MSAFKKLGCGVLLTILILCPRVSPISTCLCVFIMVTLAPFLVWLQTWENENGLDMQFFEDSQVSFNTLSKSQRETTCCSKKRFLRAGVLKKLLEIVGSVYTETRFGENIELKWLQMFTFQEETWWEKFNSMIIVFSCILTFEVFNRHRGVARCCSVLLGDEVRVPKQSNDYVIHLSSTELQPIGSVKCSCSSWRRLFSYLSTSFFFRSGIFVIFERNARLDPVGYFWRLIGIFVHDIYDHYHLSAPISPANSNMSSSHSLEPSFHPSDYVKHMHHLLEQCGKPSSVLINNRHAESSNLEPFLSSQRIIIMGLLSWDTHESFIEEKSSTRKLFIPQSDWPF